MPDIWEDDIDTDDESDLVRQLRAVIKEGKKKNAEYETELNQLRPTVRKTQLSDTLAKLGISNPKIVGLVPKDIDATEESVKAWVDEYGDVFNIQKDSATNQTSGETTSTEQTSENEGVPAEQAEQWQRIQSQASQSGVTTPDAESAQLAQLQAAAKAANGNSELYFAYLTGEKQIPTT